MKCGNMVFCDSVCPDELTACKRYISAPDRKEEKTPKKLRCLECEQEFSLSQGQIVGYLKNRRRLQAFICFSCKFNYLSADF